jgi:hypothetical protein
MSLSVTVGNPALEDTWKRVCMHWQTYGTTYNWLVFLNGCKFILFCESRFWKVSKSTSNALVKCKFMLIVETSSPADFILGVTNRNFYILRRAVCLPAAHFSTFGHSHVRRIRKTSCSYDARQMYYPCNTPWDRPCDLVVRVPGYRSRGPGFDSRRY